MDPNLYWLILLVLLAVSLTINSLRDGGKKGMVIILVFFVVAVALKLFIPSVQLYPFII